LSVQKLGKLSLNFEIFHKKFLSDSQTYHIIEMDFKIYILTHSQKLSTLSTLSDHRYNLSDGTFYLIKCTISAI